MDKNNLRVHENKIDFFKYFISLPIELESLFIEEIYNSPFGISINVLTNNLIDKYSDDIPETYGDEIVGMFNAFSDAKTNFGYSDEELIEDLKNAFIDAGIFEEERTSLKFFVSLFDSSNNVNIFRKSHLSYLQNGKNYLDTNIAVDVRPVFNDDNELISSVILNDLMISYLQHDDKKSVHIRLDEDDMSDLINTLKNALDQNYRLKQSFDKDMKFIDISSNL